MFPKSLIVKGDMTVNGKLEVRNYEDEQVLNVETAGDKITTLQGKLGINQQSYEVDGLLDIDNLSNRNIADFLQLFHPVLLNSYNISTLLFAEENYDDVNTAIQKSIYLDDYKGKINEFFAFSIDTATTTLDIEYLYYINQQEVDAVGTSAENKYTFDSNAKLKIQQLAREVAQIQRDTSSTISPMIYSFVEQYVNQTSNMAVSIKGKMYGSKLVCIATYVNIDVYMVDPSYKKLFRTFIDGLSSTNRLINYASALMQSSDIFNSLKDGYSINSITHAIRSGEFNTRFGLENIYLFCDYVDDQNATKYLFHEYYTQWNGEIASDLYLSEINLNAGTVLDIMTNSFREAYGDLYQDQTFMVAYDWRQGYKVTSTKYFTNEGITYRLSCGINVNDFVGQSIIAKGDTRFTGDFSIQTPNQTEIFKVSTRDKLISNMFNVGIGTQTPNTALDIHECGVTDIIRVLKYESINYNILNQLIYETKTAYNKNPDQDKEELIRTTIQSVFPNSKQSKSGYIGCAKLNMVTKHTDDSEFIYHWLFPDWVGQPLGKVVDPENAALLEAAHVAQQEFLDSGLLYDNSLYKGSFNFLYGQKRYCIRAFLLGETMYYYTLGINIQEYHLNPTTNMKIANWINVANAQGYMLSDMVMRSTNPGVVYNKQQAANRLAIVLNSYPKVVSNTVKVVLSNKFFDSTISDLNFHTLNETDKKVLSEITDINNRTFAVSMLDTIRTNYSNIKSGDYGIFAFEDTQYDYRGYFYAISETELFVLYLCINEYIIPTLDMYGDARIKGDLLLSSDENNVITNFVSIDPSVKYVGINTDERKLFYQDMESYTTLTSNTTPSHHVVIRNNKYPNVVMERIQEATVGSNSAATMKRTSQIYTHNEIQQLIQEKYPNNNIASWETKKTYGPDISFEIMDKTGYTREIGQLKVVVDRYDANTGNIYAGFGFQTTDPTITDGNIESQTKNLMYVDHTGTLFINKIQIGGKLLEINKDGQLTINGVVLSTTSLTSIIIPEGVTTIVEGAYQNNTDLIYIFIPKSVTSIGDNAFSGAIALKSVTFEEGSKLTTIGEATFRDAIDLTSITIPANVTTIGDNAFLSARALKFVRFEEGSLLTTIGTGAFIDATALTSITIPKSVTSIEDNAFQGAIALKSVTFEAGSKLTTIGEATFQGAIALTSITIPANVTTIGSGAFQGAIALTSITIPANVTSIGDNAFQGAIALKSVTFEAGSKLDTIGENAFSGATALTSVTFEVYRFGTPGFPASPGIQSFWGSPVTTYFLPDSRLLDVTTIGEGAYQNNTDLISITIPENVTSIGDNAFQGARALTSVTFEEGSILTSIGTAAFAYARALAFITIPANVTTIGTYAFAYAKALKSVTFEEGSKLDTIGEGAFSAYNLTDVDTDESNETPVNIEDIFAKFDGNMALTSIIIPKSVTTIGDFAFLGARALESVTFEAGSILTTIGNNAFGDARALTSITIPANVTSIGDNAFSGATALESVLIEQNRFGTPGFPASPGIQSFWGSPDTTNFIAYPSE